MSFWGADNIPYLLHYVTMSPIMIWVAFKGGIYIFEKNIKCTLEICALLCTYIKSQQTGLLGEKKKQLCIKKAWEEKQVVRTLIILLS